MRFRQNWRIMAETDRNLKNGVYMEILSISRKASLNGDGLFITELGDVGARAHKNAFGNIDENIPAFLRDIKSGLSMAGHAVQKGACALALALALSCPGPNAGIFHAPEAQAAQTYVLTAEQQDELFRKVEGTDIQKATETLTALEFERYAAFRALKNNSLRTVLDAHGIPHLASVRDAARQYGIRGNITEGKVMEIALRLHEEKKANVYALLNDRQKAESIRASSYDYYEDYEKDIKRRQKTGELNPYESPLSKMVALEFVKYGRIPSPGAGEENIMKPADIRAMWAGIDNGIRRVYENPRAAACEMADEIDCLAGDGAACKLKKGEKQWLNIH